MKNFRISDSSDKLVRIDIVADGNIGAIARLFPCNGATYEDARAVADLFNEREMLKRPYYTIESPTGDSHRQVWRRTRDNGGKGVWLATFYTRESAELAERVLNDEYEIRRLVFGTKEALISEGERPRIE